MNINIKNPVIVTHEDYQLLKGYINSSLTADHEMTLSSELKRAIIVKKSAFPLHAIGLNSKVSVQDLDTHKVFDFTLVMPAEANVRDHKVSVLTPMGAALIGFRQSEEVQWKVPAGLKKFKILEVTNPK